MRTIDEDEARARHRTDFDQMFADQYVRLVRALTIVAGDPETAADAVREAFVSTSIAAALPSAFTETYRSSGGSISVTWSGTAFSINSISPAAGYVAAIEDSSWDKVRVDFENGDRDARIEVRLHEDRITVKID